MRRLVLGAIVLMICAATAGAVVQGSPDAVYITGYVGTVSVDGHQLVPGDVVGAGVSATGYDVSSKLAGPSDGSGLRIDFSAANDQIIIDFRFNSGQAGYQQGRSPNFVLYMGDTGVGSSVTLGNVRFLFLLYDTADPNLAWPYGNIVLMQLSTPPPPVVWNTTNGATPVVWSYSVTGPSSPVYGIQMILDATVASTIYIDAIQNPEPGTMALFALGAGGLGLVVVRRRRRKKKA